MTADRILSGRSGRRAQLASFAHVCDPWKAAAPIKRCTSSSFVWVKSSYQSPTAWRSAGVSGQSHHDVGGPQLPKSGDRRFHRRASGQTIVHDDDGPVRQVGPLTRPAVEPVTAVELELLPQRHVVNQSPWDPQ